MISINENSLICATVSQDLKEFFLVYQSLHIIIITIIGFHININKDKTTIGTKYHHILPRLIWVPKSTKNITIKKSLSDFILELISNLYGDKERVIQATSAHISIENPAR